MYSDLSLWRIDCMSGISLLTVDIVSIAYARGIMQMVVDGLSLYIFSTQVNARATHWWAMRSDNGLHS